MPDWSRGADENNSVAVANGEGAVTSWQVVARRIRAVHPRARASEEGGQVTRKRVRGFVGIRERVCLGIATCRAINPEQCADRGCEMLRDEPLGYIRERSRDICSDGIPQTRFVDQLDLRMTWHLPRNAHANRPRREITVILESSYCDRKLLLVGPINGEFFCLENGIPSDG